MVFKRYLVPNSYLQSVGNELPRLHTNRPGLPSWSGRADKEEPPDRKKCDHANDTDDHVPLPKLHAHLCPTTSQYSAVEHNRRSRSTSRFPFHTRHAGEPQRTPRSRTGNRACRAPEVAGEKRTHIVPHADTLRFRSIRAGR